MSDIFETDIDNLNENLSSLEDNESEIIETENLVFDYPLYHIKLEYSSETLYAKTQGNLKLVSGDYVITPTRYGKDMALVLGESKKPIGIKQADIVTVERKATDEDLEKRKSLIEKEKNAFGVFKEKVANHKLDMKLVDIEYTFDNSKILFYYFSDGRVDFRELVKDLAAVFKTRIELRQIGVRDETKTISGLGVCGRKVCCSEFLSEFAPVSVKMARDQSLSTNPQKISGACGKLICCLNYEQETYDEAYKTMPRVGNYVETPKGNGVVSEVNVVAEYIRVKIDGDDGQHAVFKPEEIKLLSRNNADSKENDDELKELE